MTNHLAITWSKSEKVNNILTCNQAFLFIFLLLFLEERRKRHELQKYTPGQPVIKKRLLPDIFALRKIKTQLCSIIVSWEKKAQA